MQASSSQPPDLVDRLAGLLLGAARAVHLLAADQSGADHPPSAYIPHDLGVCVRLMRYRPLKSEEFSYRSGQPPEVHLSEQRRRDFVWRFMRELRDLEQQFKDKRQRPSQLGAVLQLLKHAALYENSETPQEAVAGIWDRNYRGELPPPDDPDHLYWPGRAAVAAASALILYAQTIPIPIEEDTESLQKYGQLIAFWGGALAGELVGLSAPKPCVEAAVEVAQALVHGVIAMICGDFQPRVPAQVSTAHDMLDVILLDAARGGSNIPRGEFVADRKTLEEIKNFLFAFASA